MKCKMNLNKHSTHCSVEQLVATFSIWKWCYAVVLVSAYFWPCRVQTFQCFSYTTHSPLVALSGTQWRFKKVAPGVPLMIQESTSCLCLYPFLFMHSKLIPAEPGLVFKVGLAQETLWCIAWRHCSRWHNAVRSGLKLSFASQMHLVLCEMKYRQWLGNWPAAACSQIYLY